MGIKVICMGEDGFSFFWTQKGCFQGGNRGTGHKSPPHLLIKNSHEIGLRTFHFTLSTLPSLILFMTLDGKLLLFT